MRVLVRPLGDGLQYGDHGRGDAARAPGNLGDTARVRELERDQRVVQARAIQARVRWAWRRQCVGHCKARSWHRQAVQHEERDGVGTVRRPHNRHEVPKRPCRRTRHKRFQVGERPAHHDPGLPDRLGRERKAAGRRVRHQSLPLAPHRERLRQRLFRQVQLGQRLALQRDEQVAPARPADQGGVGGHLEFGEALGL